MGRHSSIKCITWPSQASLRQSNIHYSYYTLHQREESTAGLPASLLLKDLSLWSYLGLKNMALRMRRRPVNSLDTQLGWVFNSPVHQLSEPQSWINRFIDYAKESLKSHFSCFLISGNWDVVLNILWTSERWRFLPVLLSFKASDSFTERIPDETDLF